MAGKRKQATAAAAKRPRNNNNRGRRPRAAWKVPRGEEEGSRYRQQEADRTLPAVSVVPPAAAIVTFPERRSRNNRKLSRKSEGAVAAHSFDEPGNNRHPLEDVDHLLEVFDDFIGAAAGGSSSSEGAWCGFRSRTFDNSSNGKYGEVSAPSDPCMRGQQPSRATTAAAAAKLGSVYSDRLPRLCSPPSPSRVSVLQNHPSDAENEKQPPAIMHGISFARPSTQPERDCCFVFSLQDDPLDLMLRSRSQPRPDVQGLTRFGITDKSARHDYLDTRETAATPAAAGVFRLAHPGTGFVHYGYSWDVATAEEDQLRRLKAGSGCSDGRDGCSHPHRGLSAVVRGCHHASGRCWLPAGGEGQEKEREEQEEQASRSGADILRFEVVRRVPLPTRFRATDFEDTMREACAEELWNRRAQLLVLMARKYRRKHCDPAFRRIVVACRQLRSSEEHAAAAEVQRGWRGSRGRVSARCKRDSRRRECLRIARERVSGTLAVWVQARHRGILGRRRANGAREKKEAESLEQTRRSSAVAASAIQRWVRSTSQRRRREASEGVGEADNNGGALLSAPTTTIADDEAKPYLRTARGPPRAISPSEIRAAEDLGGEDLETPLRSEVSGWSTIDSRSEDTEGRGSNANRQGKRRRPSSSRETRGTTPLDSRNHNPRGYSASDKSRGRSRPSSSGGPSARQLRDGVFGGDTKFGEWVADDRCRSSSADSSRERDILRTYAGRAPSLGLAATPNADASRLVLEGDPLFSAATAIQAAWRGFVERLRARKRRRAAAALRRKREGKWRQQRGVVGKQLSVGWDERRGLEEGDGDEGVDGQRVGGRLSCIDIQVTTSIGRPGGGGYKCHPWP